MVVVSIWHKLVRFLSFFRRPVEWQFACKLPPADVKAESPEVFLELVNKLVQEEDIEEVHSASFTTLAEWQAPGLRFNRLSR